MTCAQPEERTALREFQSRITDLVFDEFEQHEIYTMSWLRARDMNVKKAEEMIRKSVEWKRVNGIKTLLATWSPPKDYPTRYPYTICGYDNDDSPVIVAPVGKWDVRKAVDDGEAKVWLKYDQYMSLVVIEDAKKKMKETNKYISQFVGVFDLSGFTIRQLTSKACIEALMESVRQYEDNYPETLKAAYLINAPRIFAILFNIIKPLLTARTLGKIQIFDSNAAKWKLVLLNNIPAHVLPVQYGGTKKLSVGLDAGFGELCLGEDEDLVETVVEAGGELVLDFIVDVVNTTLSWKFKTENYDIGFCMKRDGVEVVAYERIDAWKSVTEGKYLAGATGKYSIIFDNKYSRLRAKNLIYGVQVRSPDLGRIAH